MSLRLFWALLTIACVVWYSTITVYVAIRGALDIKHMLKRLAEQESGGGDSPENAGDGVGPAPQ
jgi:hypothetical protein